MRKLGLSIAGVSLAALAISCGSSSTDGTPGSGGGGAVGTGGALPGGGNTGTGGAASGGGNAGTGGSVGGSATGGGGGAVSTGGAPAGGGGGVNTGGSGAGGGGNTGGSGGTPITKPSLVTSAQGAYWVEGAVTPGGTTATITVDTTMKKQAWHGWGGTFNEKGWTALKALDSAAFERAMKLLFDPAEGLGLDWGRIPIGPSDYADARYTLSSAPGEFDITHDMSTIIPYIQAAQAISGSVKYWASPWSPPPWAKTDSDCGSTTPNNEPTAGCLKNDGYDKGRFDPQFYDEYAEFFVDWITAYEAAGIPIHSVSPQNEPGWSQGYPTCSFGPATDSTLNSAQVFSNSEVTFGPFIDRLHTALQTLPSKPGIWFGTMSNDRVFGSYWDSLTDKTKVVGVALQWETLNRITPGHASKMTFPPDLLIMQSEHKCGNYPWIDGANNGQMSTAASKEAADYNSFWAPEAPNNHNYAVESWGLFKSWIDNGVNIYSAWNMVLDTVGKNLDVDRPWPQNALLAVNLQSAALEVTPYYHVYRHLAQYSSPGGSVLSVTAGGGMQALAFLNPDGSVMTTVYNPGGTAMATLSVDGQMVQFEVPGNGWATVNM